MSSKTMEDISMKIWKPGNTIAMSSNIRKYHEILSQILPRDKELLIGYETPFFWKVMKVFGLPKISNKLSLVSYPKRHLKVVID